MVILGIFRRNITYNEHKNGKFSIALLFYALPCLYGLLFSSEDVCADAIYYKVSNSVVPHLLSGKLVIKMI